MLSFEDYQTTWTFHFYKVISMHLNQTDLNLKIYREEVGFTIIFRLFFVAVLIIYQTIVCWTVDTDQR